MESGFEEVREDSSRRKSRKGVEVGSDYYKEDGNNYVYSEEEDLSDGDNDQFEEYVNHYVEADMGSFKSGSGQPEVVEEKIEDVDSNDCKSIVSSDSDDGYQVEEFRVDRDMEAPKFVASQKFSSFAVLKEAIKQHTFIEKRPIKFKKHDKIRLQAVCESLCNWYIWASKMSLEDSVQIKKCKVVHIPDFRKTFKVKYAMTKFLGAKLARKVVVDLTMSRALVKKQCQRRLQRKCVRHEGLPNKEGKHRADSWQLEGSIHVLVSLWRGDEKEQPQLNGYH
ncbi:unnamed protein product [Linum trigynum]|uniref:Transposase MuDR plant domain-containing protein n=1 Tax=Linum trigynum TaxID=586398 RepID=A0AAV2GID0_9ROSI